MNVMHRLVFRHTEENRLALEESHIPYKDMSDESHGVYEVYINEKMLPELPNIAHLASIDSRFLEYTEEELVAARWMHVRSAWQQYSIKNDADCFRYPCTECHGNREQIADVILNTKFKRIKSPFLSPPGSDIIFIDRNLAKALLESKLRGFSFREVKAKNNKTLFDPMVQLMIHNILPPAIMNPPQNPQSRYICPACGAESWIMEATPFRMREKLMGSLTEDIYYTSEFFSYKGFFRGVIISGSSIGF